MKYFIANIWFAVVSHEPNLDANLHHYYLSDPALNIHVALTTTEKLPSEPGEWVRVSGTIDCESLEINTGFTLHDGLLCNSTNLKYRDSK